ncbi:MAG TPA: 2Fe-2S iron-sulfur cluster-binding protein [Steroidobacteraceae bacterium]|nr:2Fe-2S iron-sulfur cluster-binding protein [Steroidobacteraceae bacterium]
MVRITFIEANGTTHVVDARLGSSVMLAATENRVPGIVAECGGNCACGTCCVYVEQRWREKAGEPSDMEGATMEIRDDPTPGRRLSCQMDVTKDLDGLIVRIPDSQF